MRQLIWRLWLQAVTRKTRILAVNYNASNNELVRCALSAALCAPALAGSHVVGVTEPPARVALAAAAAARHLSCRVKRAGGMQQAQL